MLKKYVEKICLKLIEEMNLKSQNIPEKPNKIVSPYDTKWMGKLTEEYLVPGMKSMLKEYIGEIKRAYDNANMALGRVSEVENEYCRLKERVYNLEQNNKESVGKQILEKLGIQQ